MRISDVLEITPLIREFAKKLLPNFAIKITELEFGKGTIKAVILAKTERDEFVTVTVNIKAEKTKLAEFGEGAKIFLKEYFRVAADVEEYLLEILDILGPRYNQRFNKLIIRQLEGGVVDCVFE